MRRDFAFVALLSIVATSAVAQEKTGWYFAGRGGPAYEKEAGFAATGAPGSVLHSPAHNLTGAFGMAGGYEWMYGFDLPLRTELEFMNRTELTYNAIPAFAGNGDALASTVQNITVMGRGYWHIPVNSSFWWPFVSGGLGWSYNTVKSTYTAPLGPTTRQIHRNQDVAWSVGAGASFKLGEDVMNDVELRYVDLGKADWSLPSRPSLRADRLTSTELIFSIRCVF